MHLHTIIIRTVPPSPVPVPLCEGCDIRLRLTTQDESNFIYENQLFREDGPMWGPNHTIVVPMDFDLDKEVANQ